MRSPENINIEQGITTENSLLSRLGNLAQKATGINLIKDSWRKTIAKELPKMNELAKTGAFGATILCLARPLYEISQLDRKPDWDKTALDILMAATDGLDGLIARETGGTTEFGAVADQFIGDKISKLVKEINMVKNSQLDIEHLLLRLSRDLAVTYSRAIADEQTEGEADIAALPKSDILSGKYSTGNIFITNILLSSPLAEKMPKGVRNFLAWQATTHLLLTGANTIYHNKKQVEKIEQDKQDLSSVNKVV